MKIGIDLDGPIYPFEYCLWDWCVNNGIREGDIPATTTWNFFEEPGWDADLAWYKEQTAAASTAGHLFYSQEPHPGAVEGLHDLRDRGHTLHIMTYRIFPGAVNNTDRWLAKYDIPFDSLSFTKDKTLIPVAIMIEDNVDNARSLDDAGIIPVIVDRAWNQDWEGPRVGDRNGPREDDWKEFVQIVDGLQVYIDEWMAAEAAEMISQVSEQSGLIVTRR